MKYHAGILDGRPDWDDHFELLALAHTPGVPFEWMYVAVGPSYRRRSKLIELMDETPPDQFRELGRENFASVVPGDGWRMLQAVCPRYNGKAAPLWSQLELRNSQRSDAANALRLGVHWRRVERWRTNVLFDPLTGERLTRW